MDSFEEEGCTGACMVRSVLSLFGKKNAMAIIRQLLVDGTLRFNQLHQKVGGHPKTTQKRLEELSSFGLVRRVQYDEIPPRVEYSLTEPGKEMEDIFQRISLWTGRWRDSLS